jgi:peptidoglycan/xylan/chitin deacetylase (PgdA/CDA1 family)
MSMLQSIDKKFIISVLILLILSISKSFGSDINKIDTNKGILTLMYHRFEENKYPSTNVKNDIFLQHLKEINNAGLEFIDYKYFKKIINTNINKNYLLLTIDDAFESFYLNAWPILKSKKIPFILFVSTREVGKKGYMNWGNLKELSKNNFVTIGNHSHSHDYLIDWDDEKIKSDLQTSIKIFEKELGYSPEIFSYPFGEYSSNLKTIVKKLNFSFAFGQHSGVIDVTKDFLELPRFPINEKYGELKRFKSIIKTLPFPYKSITPKNRYLLNDNNPPKVKINFFEDLIDIKNINCYSNEGNVWKKSDIKFINKNEIIILLKERFKSERGRINCSLLEKNGKWRWLGIQYVVAEY